ncbi:uncharacterized protein OCT59_008310 [Rhizophagus irregularis]|uniref:uncharacterized protein n=1 Tax=Rhizophagus irregularis TaxID=588596 RepID=UPI0033339013|nr:hypothetical protein OCT59_008310 [Rhizophagus irregularis]
MFAIRKNLVYAAIQEAFSEADKNPNLNYDLTNQQKLLNGIIFADNSLTKDEKAETARIIDEKNVEGANVSWFDEAKSHLITKPKNATEEEQRAFHSKPYAFNLSDSNKSSTLKIKKYFKDLSKNLTDKFKSLRINSENDDNRNENELLQQANNNINTNHYNMKSNSIDLSTRMEKDIFAYNSSETIILNSSREYSNTCAYDSSVLIDMSNSIREFSNTCAHDSSVLIDMSNSSREYSNTCAHDSSVLIGIINSSREYSIGNISSKDLAESSRTNRITTEKDYVGITNSEDQDELEIPDEKNLNRRLG